MIKQISLSTKHLNLSPWQESDLAPFAEMNQDPDVMKFYPALLSYEESKLSVKKKKDHFEQYGWGLWSAHLKSTNEFIGYIGLMHIPFTAHFTPAVEIGWRLKKEFWGKGLATEGAKECLRFGFEILQLPEIVSFTVPANTRSESVMKRLGMHTTSQDNFAYPNLLQDHPLSTHILYRLTREEWLSQS